MTKIVILQYGEPWTTLVSTSMIKAINKKYDKASIDWATTSSSYPLLQYNSRIRDVLVGYGQFYNQYDIAINLSPTREACLTMNNIESKIKLGFGEVEGNVSYLNNDAKEGFDVLYKGLPSDRHILQIIFRIAGLKWRGEGYDLAYYPKNKMKKGKTGIAISDSKLRKYVKSNLQLNQSELWHVPMKQDLLKRIDEINRCKRIVTNDLFSAHAAIAMRKHVEFLDDKRLNMGIEFFGNGNHIKFEYEQEKL